MRKHATMSCEVQVSAQGGRDGGILDKCVRRIRRGQGGRWTWRGQRVRDFNRVRGINSGSMLHAPLKYQRRAVHQNQLTNVTISERQTTYMFSISSELLAIPQIQGEGTQHCRARALVCERDSPHSVVDTTVASGGQVRHPRPTLRRIRALDVQRWI